MSSRRAWSKISAPAETGMAGRPASSGVSFTAEPLSVVTTLHGTTRGRPGTKRRAAPGLMAENRRVDTGELLGRYRPQGEAERGDVSRVNELVRTAADP